VRVIFRNLGLVAAFFTLFYISSGCNEATILGNELIPGKDFVNGEDTTILDIITHNIFKTDSTVYTGRGNFNKVLGSIVNDPLFGSTHGIVYTQMSLPSSGYSWPGSNQKLDSVVLSLGITGYYGDSLAPQTFRVYRMSEPDFKIDSNYRYYQKLAYNAGELLGTATVIPRSLKDSVSVYGTKEGPQLRIKLSTAFGNQLLQQTSSTGFTNDSTFRAFLKGFAIVPDTTLATNRTMLYANMTLPETHLTVFFSNTENDSLRTTFSFGATSAHANYYVRNFAGSQAGQYINTNNPNGDSLLYLTDVPGIFTKITIPGLENFPNSVINKAELVVTEISTAGNEDAIFSEPDFLFLQQYDSISGETTRPVIDYGNPQNPNQPYFGGDKTEVTVGGVKVAQYRFNIARYMQFLLRKQEQNTGFKLEALSPKNIDVHRVKAGGGKHSQYGIKLRIIYTKP
jgi:hypothetical protein